MHLASSLASAGKKVLLVDTDPQCNLTSYLIQNDVVDDLLDHADTERGQTLWSAVKPISEAQGGIHLIRPIEVRDNLFILPGDIRLSEFEEDLTDFWGQCVQRKIKGFRGTTAISELVNTTTINKDIDIVFYDAGPNIGSLNRAILLDCDGFVVPLACDLFSLRALKTLGRSLHKWITEWKTIIELAPEMTYLLPGMPSFLGYVPGGFRTYRGVISQQSAHFLPTLEREIHSQLVVPLRGIASSLASGRTSQFKLGEVKHFGALVGASQNQGLPMWEVDAGTPSQRATAKKVFGEIATRLTNRLRSSSE